MFSQPDEEFDRLCREASMNPEGSPSPDGWEKLRLRLDLEMPEKKERRKGWFFWIPFLLSLPLAMWYWMQHIDHGNAMAAARDTHKDPITKESSPPALTSILPVPDERKKEPIQKQGSAGSMQAAYPSAVSSPAPFNRKPIRASRPVERDQPKTFNGAISKQEDTTALRGTAAGQSSGEAAESLTLADSSSTVAKPDPAEPGIDSAGQTQPKDARQEQQEKGVGFLAVAGPDFSSVHFSSGSKVGYNLGLLFEYHFNKRLSLQAGMIYARKNYTAMGNEYGKIPGYDVNNPNFKMEKVEAYCNMWEFPLNIRYNLIAGSRHRMFMAGGFSSYYMNREDLHYYYTFYNVSKYKNWMNDQSSIYWFAVSNLSLGYEYRFNPNLSVQAEPYIKIPVREMGYGNVPINSMGILFGIRYLPFNTGKRLKN